MATDLFVPLLTYPDPSPEAGLLRAVDFAATIGGRLSALTHVVTIPRVSNPLAAAVVDIPALSAAVEAGSRKAGEDLDRHLTGQARRMAVELTSETLACRAEEIPILFAERARTHDLSLVAFDGGSEAHRGLAEGLLFESGGPVVFFPGNDAAAHFETVAVAWDGSAPAARAVRDAMPILRRSGNVVVLSASGDKPIAEERVGALRAFLTRQDVETLHAEVPIAGTSIGDALQQTALAQDAGLLVMGAYGHSRLRQFVLGGATRSVLTGMSLPVFMSR